MWDSLVKLPHNFNVEIEKTFNKTAVEAQPWVPHPVHPREQIGTGISTTSKPKTCVYFMDKVCQ